MLPARARLTPPPPRPPTPRVTVAPEVAAGTSVSKWLPVDVWGLGVVLHDLSCRGTSPPAAAAAASPSAGGGAPDVSSALLERADGARLLRARGYDPGVDPAVVPAPLVRLLETLLEHNPLARATAASARARLSDLAAQALDWAPGGEAAQPPIR